MTNKLVVITGAGSGIGTAIAQHFSAAGHPLLLLGRRIERLQALDLPDTLCEEVDVTDAGAFSAAVAKAEARSGPAEILINNAGLMLLGELTEQNPEEWRRMFEVNVFGVLNGMKTVLGGMKARNSGTVVNIGSIAGHKTFPEHAIYCGTKFAVHAISESVREEMTKSNVRVITISPGVTETELLSHTPSEEIRARYDDWKKDMGHVLHPDDVARAVLFACRQPQGVCVREIVLASTSQLP